MLWYGWLETPIKHLGLAPDYIEYNNNSRKPWPYNSTNLGMSNSTHFYL